jgi:TATA-box binding protein (TBP) (component of TFIID and TFIIIB)
MRQGVRDFVRRSGVEIQSPNSNSNSDNNFARELEEIMIRKERERAAGFRTPPPRQARVPPLLQRNMVNNRSYEGAFREFEENEFAGLTNNNLRELLAPNDEISLEMTKLNPGMFNATVDSGFGQKDAVVDLKKILLKTPLPKTAIGEGLYLDTNEIKGWYGSMREGFSHTREAGPKGNIGIAFFTAQFKMTMSNDLGESKGVTVNIYKNGKIRFSGGFVGTNIANQPELIRRFVVNSYTERQPFFYNPFTYNNLSGQFKINGIFKDPSVIAQRARMYGIKDASYEPELSPFMYVYTDDAKFILTKSGNVQITGAKNPADMLKAYGIGKTMIEALHRDDQIIVTGKFDEGVKARTKLRAKAKAKTTPQPKRTYAKRTLDAKSCLRMKKPELVNLARKMGVVNFRVRGENGFRAAKKEEICKKLLNKVGNKTNTTFRVGKKICRQMKKNDLLKTAAIMKIDVNAKDTKDTICKKLETAQKILANAKASPKPKPKPVPPVKKGFEENSIRKDISKLYGKRWMQQYKNVMPSINNDVREMKARLNKMPGKPLKRNINQVKKQLVEKWKNQRKRDLDKKLILKSLNVNGIPRNMVNAYKTGALNYIMTHKPTKAKLARYKKTWVNNKKNTKNAKPVPIVKAKRERMI